MEGQTNCVLCDYKSRSIGSLKQHMENKHNVYNMTIVQVLTQQVERVTDLESEIKAKEQCIQKAEVDLDETREALKKEKERLKEKEKVFDDLITAQKLKALEEEKIVDELNLTKGLLNKAQADLETKTIALKAELEKVEEVKVLTQTLSERNKGLNVKKEEIEVTSKVKHNTIPCKYFHKTNGCRRGKKCWFYHDKSCKEEKNINTLNQNLTKKVKKEQNVVKEKKKEHSANVKQIIIELLKLLVLEEDCDAPI